MVIRQLSEADLRAAALGALGLPMRIQRLEAPEVIAATLRRAAGFRCPCPRRTLREAALAALALPAAAAADLAAAIEATLDAMIASGDLLEERDVAAADAAAAGMLVYTAPPSFVLRDNGDALLLGVVADHRSALPPLLERRIAYVGHVRFLRAEPGEDLRALLRQRGLLELPRTAWLLPPPPESCDEHLGLLGRALRPVVGDVPDLTVLDPDRPVRYYRGRWDSAQRRTGRFVARRAQRYGAPLWCYVELEGGVARGMVDLPLSGSAWRGCDEAWRLQAAIDAARGRPQVVEVRPGPEEGTQTLACFSPVPAWVHRRWDAVGRPAEAASCLFAYAFPAGETAEELAFAAERLWLAPADRDERVKGSASW